MGNKIRSRITYDHEHLPTAIDQQTNLAIKEGDLLILLTDGQEGPTDYDLEILNWIRRYFCEKPVLLAINKCDNILTADQKAAAFYQLGLEPIPISAISGISICDLMDRVVEKIPTKNKTLNRIGQERSLKVALVGRPNVGKSSLMNAILCKDRSMVSYLTGTTRDAITNEFTSPDGQPFIFYDTPGIRSKSSVIASNDTLEKLSTRVSMREIQLAGIVILVLDINEGVMVHDYYIFDLVKKEERPCVIVINKFDVVSFERFILLSKKEKKIQRQLKLINWVRSIITSAKFDYNIEGILQVITISELEHKQRIPTANINIILSESRYLISASKEMNFNVKKKILYGTQVSIKPPQFVIFVNNPSIFTKKDRDTIKKQIRNQVGFIGTPIKLNFKKKS